MIRATSILFALALTLSVSAQQGSPHDVPSEDVAADNDLSSMNLDDLIQHLPPVGAERVWNAETQSTLEDPYAQEMRSRIDSGVALTDDQWRTALLSTGVVRLRETWPRDEPLVIPMKIPRWLGLSQIQVTPCIDGARTAFCGTLIQRLRCGNGSHVIHSRAQTLRPLCLLPPNTTSVSYSVKIERGPYKLEYDKTNRRVRTPTLLWTGEITSEISMTPQLEDTLPGVDTAEIRRALRNSLTTQAQFRGLRYRPSGATKMSFIAAENASSELNHTALSLRIEILDGDERLAVLHLIPSSLNQEVGIRSRDRSVSLIVSHLRFIEDLNLNGRRNAHVRITGTSRHVLDFADATQYWNGSMTIPLRELRRPLNP